MAPRGRPKKTGGERMEEVLRHFRIENLGFEEEVVRKVALQILKEYDVGEEAWCFIAQNNYELLIEQILEYQENNQPEGSSGVGNEDDFFEDEPLNEHALAVSEEPSAAITAMNISQQEDTAEDTEGDAFSGQNLLLTNETVEVNETRHRSPSPVYAKSPVARRRLPCYGWIDENEENEEDEFIILTSADQVSKVSPIASEKNLRKKRGSQWDLRPEDT